MIRSEFETIIEDIYNLNLQNINQKIVDALTLLLSEKVFTEDQIVPLLQVLDAEMRKQNYVFVVDIIKYEILDKISE